MLVGVAGRGWYQEEGKPAQEILPGTVIHIPANVKQIPQFAEWGISVNTNYILSTKTSF